MENTASTKWKLTLNSTTIANNHAGDAGGGVEEDGTGTVNINNSAGMLGGGIGNAGNAAVTILKGTTVALVDDTITGNFAADGGGLFFAGAMGLTVQNTASAAGPMSI